MLKCHSENLSQTACLKDPPPPLTLCLITLIFFHSTVWYDITLCICQFAYCLFLSTLYKVKKKKKEGPFPSYPLLFSEPKTVFGPVVFQKLFCRIKTFLSVSTTTTYTLTTIGHLQRE